MKELDGIVWGLPKELRQRTLDLLAQLSKLSEAPASSLGKQRGKPDSRPPTGALQDPEARRPDPDIWLREWFIWRLFRGPKGLHALHAYVLATVTEGEIRLAKRLHKPPAEMEAGTLGRPAVDTEGRDKRIAQEYQGLTPEEVAIVESHRAGYLTPENVKRVRVTFGRDPEDGSHSPYLLLKPDEKREKALELRVSHSLREIAGALGVSHGTVKRWVDKEAA